MKPCKRPDAPVVFDAIRPDAPVVFDAIRPDPRVVIGQIQDELAQLEVHQRALLAQLEQRRTGVVGPARVTPAVALVATGIALIKASLR